MAWRSTKEVLYICVLNVVLGLSLLDHHGLSGYNYYYWCCAYCWNQNRVSTLPRAAAQCGVHFLFAEKATGN